jgi:thiol-disulfide isomerase/thioredoxin
MKTSLSIAIAISLVLPLSAAFEDWTNKEGKTAQLELVEVIGEADAKEGVFKMRNGRMVNIKQADLAEADAKRLADWKPAAVPASGAASVFDEALDGNLVILDGKRLKKHELASKPTKYYLFYYTASWCPPCQAFTPSLVKFYQANKPNNDEFEIILVTSDSEEKDMEKYAISSSPRQTSSRRNSIIPAAAFRTSCSQTSRVNSSRPATKVRIISARPL